MTRILPFPLRAGTLTTLLVAALSLAGGSPGATAAPPGDEAWSPFEATWSAAGHVQTLRTGDREAATVRLSGAFLLTKGEGLRKGFNAEAIAYSDGAGSGVGTMVLTDDRGEKVFCTLAGSTSEKGKAVLATITGGTGVYSGIAGDFSFRWHQLAVTGDGEIHVLAVNLKGRYRRISPPDARPDGGPK